MKSKKNLLFTDKIVNVETVVKIYQIEREDSWGFGEDYGGLDSILHK